MGPRGRQAVRSRPSDRRRRTPNGRACCDDVVVRDQDLVTSVLGQDRSETKKFGLGLGPGLGLAGLLLFGETGSCHARHHNDLVGHSTYICRFSTNLVNISYVVFA